MSKYKIIFLFVFSISCINISAKTSGENVNIGLLENYELFLGLGNKKFLSKYFKQFGQRRGFNLKTFFYKNSLEQYNDYKNNRLSLAFLDIEFFFNNEKEIRKNTKDYTAISFREESNIEYCLVANKEIEFKSYKDLKNKKLSLLQNNEASYIWINKKSLEANHKSAKKVLKKIEYQKKETTSLLNVYFKKVDFAVIKKAIWFTMKDLNPSISKKVVLKECTKGLFPAYVAVVNKNINKKNYKIVFDFLSHNDTAEDVEEFFSIIPFNHLFKIKIEDMKKLREFFKEYGKLKKRYE